jgi:peptide-methionine (S)-S-oxide reductase
LVEAGAKLDITDSVYNGTPLGWALHMENDESPNEEARRNFAEIADYLRKEAHSNSRQGEL